MSNRIRRALFLLALAATYSAVASAAGGEDQVTRCFELRDSDPAQAVTLAERTPG